MENYMFRISKTLNHNAVLAVSEENRECLVLAKGIGFGRKINEYIEISDDATVYSLQETTERGNSGQLARSIDPLILEMADFLLDKAEDSFGKIDRNILLPLADHMEYAIKRIQNNEEISNPLTADIQVLFHMEYKVAEQIVPVLKKEKGIVIHDDELGYIALHIHSAIEDSRVSEAMQMAQAVRDCISMLESETGHKISVMSLSYNRLMNHIRYMVARAITGEKLKVNMNDYMSIKFPKAFQIAKTVCNQVAHNLRREIDDVEIGYLAMHVERTAEEEQ